MKFVYCFLGVQLLVLLLSRDVNSLSLGNEDIEAKTIEKRSPSPKKASETCGKNEVFSKCGSSCETTCDDINNDDRLNGQRCMGAAVCNEKCVCKENYVRDTNKNCIRKQECPRVKH